MTVCPWRYTCWEQPRFIKEPVYPTWSVLAAGHKCDEVQPAQAQSSPGNAFGEYQRVISTHRLSDDVRRLMIVTLGQLLGRVYQRTYPLVPFPFG
jgi:hypothetical protein